MNCQRCRIEAKQELCPTCKPFGPSTTPLPTISVPNDAVSLGADPELLFVDGASGNKVISATRFVPDSLQAPLGVDGNSTVAELRPKPAKNVYELAETCKRLLTQAVAKTLKQPNVKLFAGHGTGGVPIGGHVHFGVRPSGDLLKALDVASIYLMAYDDTPSARRRRNSYGKLGNYESKSYGFEYRTPQSWLSHPDLMKETVSLFHSIALESKVNVEGFKKWVATYSEIMSVLAKAEPESQVPEWKHSPMDILNAHWRYNHKRVFKKFVPAIQGLITDLTAMRLNWNGYRPLLHQLLDKAWHRSKYDSLVDVNAWNITLNTRAKRVPLIVFRESDGYFQEIAPKVKARFTQDAGVVVFGLKKSRPCDIGVSKGLPSPVVDMVRRTAEEFGWKMDFVDGTPFGVGINKTLRVDKQERVVEFLNALQDKLATIVDLPKMMSLEHNSAYRKSRLNPQNVLGLGWGESGDETDLIRRFERALTSQFRTMSPVDDEEYDGEELEPDYSGDEQ